MLRLLDWLAERILAPEKTAAHHRTGRRGEEAAYFYLRRIGYTMVARNFRSPRCRGEIDLIAWEDNTLCFIEVKTPDHARCEARRSRSGPPQAAPDRRRGARISAPLSTFVPVAVRRGKRILWAIEGQTAAD